MNCTAANN